MNSGRTSLDYRTNAHTGITQASHDRQLDDALKMIRTLRDELAENQTWMQQATKHMEKQAATIAHLKAKR